MNHSPAMLRKAAILVATVDGRTAELLLAQMDPVEARTVRRAAAALDTISKEEQEEVQREFCELTTRAEDSTDGAAAVLGDGAAINADAFLDEAAEDVAAVSTATEPSARQNVSSERAGRFALLQANGDALARLLALEQPQTVATLFTQMAPRQAADVLQLLPHSVQAEVVQRLATTESVAPQVLREIEQVLEVQLRQIPQPQPKCSAAIVGLSTAARLLDAASYDVRQTLLSSLARRDAVLARRLAISPLQPAVDVTA